MKTLRAYLIVASLIASSCTGLGQPTPQTFNERLATGYSLVTTVRNTAETLLLADKITPDDAQTVQDQANSARTALDVTRTLHSTEPLAADDRLSSIITGLKAIDAYLITQKE